MATQVSTIQVKGKLGNIVGYRGRRAKNLARSRVTEIKNPNTIGQAIQRMITATNARAYSRLKAICDHSFQGVSYGQLSQDFFLKENAGILRQWVANQYPNTTIDNPLEYVGLSGKNNLNATGVGLLISKGTLPAIPARSDADGVLAGFGGDLTSNDPTVTQVLNALGAVPGDQISIVALTAGGVQLARYVTKSNASAESLAANFSDTNLRAICDTEKSIFASGVISVKLDSNNGTYVFLPVNTVNTGVMGAAVILSRKAADGTWLRSTQTLVWTRDADTADLESPERVIPEWMAGTVQIDTRNPYFLNQGTSATKVL